MLLQNGNGNGNSDEDMEVVTFDENDPDTMQFTEIAAANIPDDRLQDFCDSVNPTSTTNTFFRGKHCLRIDALHHQLYMLSTPVN